MYRQEKRWLDSLRTNYPDKEKWPCIYQTGGTEAKGRFILEPCKLVFIRHQNKPASYIPIQTWVKNWFTPAVSSWMKILLIWKNPVRFPTNRGYFDTKLVKRGVMETVVLGNKLQERLIEYRCLNKFTKHWIKAIKTNEDKCLIFHCSRES